MLRLVDQPTPLELPLFGSPVEAGFPSPADDHIEGKLDLNEHLVRRPAATFFVRAAGESMRGAGIFDGDLLVIDRGITPQPDDIVIAVVHGELTVKRLQRQDGAWQLAAENPRFPTLPTRDITDAVLRIFERIWRDGYGWRKAGVLLLDLVAPSAVPTTLFDAIEKPDGLMEAIDLINARFGRGKARLGLAGKNAEWHMRQENLSPSYTTRWNDLPSVRMG